MGTVTGDFTRGRKAGQIVPLPHSGHQEGFPRAPENSLPFLTISSPCAAAGTPASLGKSSPAPGAVFPGSSCPRFTGDGHERGTAQVTWSPM